MNNTLYIVTGAYGHLGSTIVSQLIEQGQSVRCLVLPNEQPSVPQENFAKCEIVKGDVTDKQSLQPLFDGEEKKILIHCAGIISIGGAISPIMHKVNIGGVKNVIDVCLEHKCRMVYISSVHAIPALPKKAQMREIDSFSPDKVKGGYAKTKAIATQSVLDAVRNDGLDAVILFPSGIIGPNDSGKNHLVSMVDDFLKGKLRAIVKGGYDTVDVRDVAQAVIKASQSGESGESYILSGGYHSLKEIVGTLSEITGIKPIKTVLPLWFATVFIPLCELYYKIRHVRPLYTLYSLGVLVSNANFDNGKAKRQLGFAPRTLKETLVDTVKYLRDNCHVVTPTKLLSGK